MECFFHESDQSLYKVKNKKGLCFVTKLFSIESADCLSHFSLNQVYAQEWISCPILYVTCPNLKKRQKFFFTV